MSPIGQGGLFLLQFFIGLVVFSLVIRFMLRAAHVDWRHPIVTFIAKITNPLCAPLNKVMTTQGRWDWNALLTAVILQAIFAVLIGYLTDKDYSIGVIALYAVTEIMNQVLDMMFWLIIIQAVLSWVSQGYNPNTAIFFQLADPILKPFQKIIPPVGGIDLSPLAAILAIKLVQIVIVGSLAQLGNGFLV